MMMELAGFMTKDLSSDQYVLLYNADLKDPIRVPKDEIVRFLPLIGVVMQVKAGEGAVKKRGFLKHWAVDASTIDVFQSDLGVPQVVQVKDILSIEYLTAVRLVLKPDPTASAGEAGYLSGMLASAYLPDAAPAVQSASTTPPPAVDYVLCVATHIQQIPAQ